MPAVLRIPLRKVIALHDRRIPLQLILEDPKVVVHILRVVAKSLLLADSLKPCPPSSQVHGTTALA